MDIKSYSHRQEKSRYLRLLETIASLKNKIAQQNRQTYVARANEA